MADKIIVAVCSYPVLYDTSSPFYRDRNKKVQAWTKVSQVVGLPGEFLDVCRKKWKGLRDVYLRERKKEAGPVKRWRFFAIMSFLDPFVTPILSSDNMLTSNVDSDGAAPAFTTVTPVVARTLSGKYWKYVYCLVLF
uniref:MADF domain-containing protein n=1 Tax=Gouania willdenowi TaxID=441366 RepID=A0A8C5DKW8_GOUWI